MLQMNPVTMSSTFEKLNNGLQLCWVSGRSEISFGNVTGVTWKFCRLDMEMMQPLSGCLVYPIPRMWFYGVSNKVLYCV